MKFSAVIILAIIVLVQVYFTESASDKHAYNKRKISGLWGKRSESDSDELLYRRILQELYQNARRNQMLHDRYLAENDVNPLTLDQFLAQRTIWKDENENASENSS